jgi:hypothetical protein
MLGLALGEVSWTGGDGGRRGWGRGGELTAEEVVEDEGGRRLEELGEVRRRWEKRLEEVGDGRRLVICEKG